MVTAVLTVCLLLVLLKNAEVATLLKASHSQVWGQNSLNLHDNQLQSIKVHTKYRTKKFPDVLIIGVRKGGTRALIDMLKSHPRIVAAVSEVHYFDHDDNFANGVQWYINRMPYSLDDQVTIEKSPSYFVSSSAPHRIFTLSPKQKIILIVRNPIVRAVSDYAQLNDKKENERQSSFEEEVFLTVSGLVNTASSPVSVSMYDVHFARWLEYFSLDQILVIDGDVLISEPVSELVRVEKFLDVNHFFTEDMFYYNSTKGFHCWRKNNKSGKLVPVCLGKSKGRRHPKLSNDTEQKLATFFSPHNNKFYEQVKRTFDWEVRRT